ncbi:MAG: 50S ribosomal protein L19 [Planctomycetes bacterium]|nr:50S ribosomal protein L19 [Planctomycetota bacterium]
MNLLEQVQKEQFRKKSPDFGVGDTVDVHVKIREGEKDRIQIFQGVVIKRKGGSLDETFTVRRIVQGEGVERVFLLHSPRVVDLKIVKKGMARRAKLYYLRQKVGKGTRIREAYGEREPAAETAGAAASAGAAGAAAAPAPESKNEPPAATPKA